jgi:hypothetical protein
MRARSLGAKEDECEAILAVYRGDLQKALVEAYVGAGGGGRVMDAPLATACLTGV